MIWIQIAVFALHCLWLWVDFIHLTFDIPEKPLTRSQKAGRVLGSVITLLLLWKCGTFSTFLPTIGGA